MPGKPINQSQVNLYMSYRKKSHTQASAAAKTGFSERTARRIDGGTHRSAPSTRIKPTRKDPFNGLFEEILVPLLEANPALQPITLLDALDNIAPGQFDESHLRTLQRRVNKWRIVHGPDKEVIFRQKHLPAVMGISDYTWMTELDITIKDEPFKHKLYHFRLPYSGWSYVQVVQGGESFESLAAGLQGALWACGGVPIEHRTDSLSAAFNNHAQEQQLTERYQQLCDHYGLKPTRNNKGIAHENGTIESPNGHLKRKIDQQLLLRGHRDFTSIPEYEAFLKTIINKLNRRCRTRFEEEKRHLSPLPPHKTSSFREIYVRVTTSGTIQVRRVTYTVPSRLIGVRLLVHVYDDKLILFYGHEQTLQLQRVYTHHKNERARSIDYRHLIHSLAKKPNAFKGSRFRDDIIPAGDFTLLWQALTQDMVKDEDCHYMVKLLLIAHNYDCEKELARYVYNAFEKGERVSIQQCEERFGNSIILVDQMVSQQHALKSYDLLLGGHYV